MTFEEMKKIVVDTLNCDAVDAVCVGVFVFLFYLPSMFIL